MNSRLSKEKLFKTWLGIFIGDAYGAGPEMKSHEFITQTDLFNKLDKGFTDRSEGFNLGFTPGNHTDDAEMSQGTYKALVSNDGLLTLESLRDAWNYYYHKSKSENNGIPRAGYGSWKNVAEASEIEQTKIWISQRKRQASKEPGNGPNMRQLPIVMYSQNNEQVYRNTVINVLASHPHPIAVIACLAVNIANVYLMLENGPPKNVISHVIKNLEQVFNSVQNLLKEDPIYKSNENEKYLIKFLNKLKIIDELPKVKDVKCSNVDFKTLAYPYAKPLKGETGLAARSENTAYCTLYFLKWSENATIYENLKRTICFGGDTDSLACTVLPVVMCIRDTTPDSAFKNHNWILKDLEGLSFIKSIFNE
jgi:ADP-ribosylglycohydrolase